MKIVLNIGLEACGVEDLQAVWAANRDCLAEMGVLFPRSPGKKNHTRLWMSVTDPEHVDALRWQRGYADPEQQAYLRQRVMQGLRREIDTHKPDTLLLSATQLCWLYSDAELHRLRNLLLPLSSDISLVAFIDEQAALTARLYAQQVRDGRSRSLSEDLLHAEKNEDWWTAPPSSVPERLSFGEIEHAPFWLDYGTLLPHWSDVFGRGSFELLPCQLSARAADEVLSCLPALLGLPKSFALSASNEGLPTQSALWLRKARDMNHMLKALHQNTELTVPKSLWRTILNSIPDSAANPETDAAHLSVISERFKTINKSVLRTQPALENCLRPPPPARSNWREPVPEDGFRASQVLLTCMGQIERACRDRNATQCILQPINALAEHKLMRLAPDAMRVLERLRRSPFAPKDFPAPCSTVSETEDFSPSHWDAPSPTRQTVIVACMKNEAPYILEWIAFHRAIGVNAFLVYTNDCDDGTDHILSRLDELGIVEHRRNDSWTGKSPQQHALNQALREPVVQNADWVAHIDVDEFINIRCGNGTLADLHARLPEATHIAMTWRLFGHSGIENVSDSFVTEQFEHCAPSFCPKPHTAWGFKTLFRNTGAYQKLSCHRPNKLREAEASSVTWVNGSGEDITDAVLRTGWRNSRKTIGYDLVQLNHYALRSVDSFLIKRERGRALHVDRSIGVNYWTRMDWSRCRDLSIQRNLPRLRHAFADLLKDQRLAECHRAGLDWHRMRAEQLRRDPDVAQLCDSIGTIDLTDLERVACTLSMDMAS